MAIKKEAAPGKAAGKHFERVGSIISRIFPLRKPCRCAPELWSLCADLIALLAQVQDQQAEFQRDLDAALRQLGTIEAALWAEKGGDDE